MPFYFATAEFKSCLARSLVLANLMALQAAIYYVVWNVKQNTLLLARLYELHRRNSTNFFVQRLISIQKIGLRAFGWKMAARSEMLCRNI